MGALEGLGLVESEGGETQPEATATPVPSPQTSSPPSTITATAVSGADPAMVTKIRAAVTNAGHSPRLASFLAQLEIARQAFPNDEKTAVAAALAFSKLSAAEIREELSKSAAAALVEAEQSIRNDIRNKRENASGELEKKSLQLQAEVTSLEEQLASISQKLAAAKAGLAGITSERLATDTGINEMEAKAMSSHAVVKAELDKINTLLP